MKFGLFYEWPNPETGDWKRLFEESIEQIQYSEEMDFEFVLIAEHHFSNYGNSPAPLLQAMAIAERTKTIKIATAALVLPLWQPLRVAEEVAVLDNLSGGRFICGVGRGYQPHEFARFDVDPEESRVMFEESLEVMIKAWTSDESFTYDGKFIKIPNETVVWPKPFQKPYPPLLLAGTSAESVVMAARHDMALVTTGFRGPQGVVNTLGAWVHERELINKPIDTLDLGVQSITLVTDTDEQARADLRYPLWQLRANRALNATRVTNGRVDAQPYDGELDQDGMFDTLNYGNPDRITEKFRALGEAGATRISSWTMLGGIPHEKIMNSIKLMGEEVIPALDDFEPSPDLYRALSSESDTSGALRSTGPIPS